MTDDEIRQVVLEHMQNHKITKADVARRLGVTHQAVSSVLGGKSGKIPSSLNRVLAAVGLQLVVAELPREKDGL